MEEERRTACITFRSIRHGTEGRPPGHLVLSDGQLPGTLVESADERIIMDGMADAVFSRLHLACPDLKTVKE